jgi:hypothetical protein
MASFHGKMPSIKDDASLICDDEINREEAA